MVEINNYIFKPRIIFMDYKSFLITFFFCTICFSYNVNGFSSLNIVVSGGGQTSSSQYQSYVLIGQPVSGLIVSTSNQVVLSGALPSFFPPAFNPTDVDLDSDGLPDTWERTYGLNEQVDNASVDFDLDGLSDLQEFQLGTNPVRPDTDSDGLLDGIEVLTHSTNPLKVDSDGDGYSDLDEVTDGTNPLDDSSNPGMQQGAVLFNPFRRLNVAGARGAGGGLTGFNGVGQGVGLVTSFNGEFQSVSPLGWREETLTINPRNRDSDGDGMNDVWEETFGIDPLVNNAGVDTDGDGLSNIQEFTLTTNPILSDTDGDGLTDFSEVNAYSSNPLEVDSDSDGFEDGEEVYLGNNPISNSDYPGVVISVYRGTLFQISSIGGRQSSGMNDSFFIGGGSYSEGVTAGNGLVNMTGLLFSTQGGGVNPTEVDTDGDGMTDLWENSYGLNSLFDDSAQDGDGDGLSNIQEFALLTNPVNMDSDRDGLSDGDENGQYSTNPLLADTDGDGYLDGFEINNGGDPLSSANYPGSSAHQSFGRTLAWNVNSSSGWMLGGGGQSLGLVGQPYWAGVTSHQSIVNRSGFLGAIGDAGSGSSGVDADNDGLPDAWEQTYGFNPLVADSAGDLDGDGLSNLEEYTANSNPNLSDTDGDGVGDAQEVNLYFSDPTMEDTDGDGYTDFEEVSAGTSASSAVEYPDWNVTLVVYQSSLHVQNVAGGWHVHSGNATSFSSIGSFSSPPVTTSGDFSNLTGFTFLTNPPLMDPSSSDSDGDGLPDTWESVYGLSVTQANASDDQDGDTLSNLVEFQQGTNPNISDTDEDGLSDGDEVNLSQQ